jgi:hypothetical protein
MSRERRPGTRGQTTIDYAIGAGLFLVSVAFIVAFVPGIISPFQTGVQEETITADRVADQLAEGMLVGADSAYVLDQPCTVAFFDDSVGSSACTFDNGDDPADRLGLTDRQHLEVRVVADANDDGTSNPICEDGGGGIVESTVGTCASDAFVAGENPPDETGSVVVARRAVSIDGFEATLYVRMW